MSHSHNFAALISEEAVDGPAPMDLGEEAASPTTASSEFSFMNNPALIVHERPYRTDLASGLEIIRLKRELKEVQASCGELTAVLALKEGELSVLWGELKKERPLRESIWQELGTRMINAEREARHLHELYNRRADEELEKRLDSDGEEVFPVDKSERARAFESSNHSSNEEKEEGEEDESDDAASE